ncbi:MULTISPECIES: hypothetical protein [unclassified Micromonospora]|uniref:YqeB family protein n=1 Tax=unclassified Micromonospora TaxID=2617518 RepID=UPI0022B604AD|nr:MULTISPECIES: hypothetical protein [unclassified Micromonospora]MCZ7420680.1 hypothetical protein [Verrucosispora sp. WMMA2121]WBB88868.1 hypothetical protein O7597_17640 [Verrucosispora sp. WMMC514]
MRAYGSPTVVSGGITELVVLWGGIPLVGGALGGLVVAGSGWVADLPWAPVQGLFRALDGLPDTYSLPGGVGVGILVGLVIAAIGTAERVRVTVSGAEVRLREGSSEREIDRRDTRAVYLDGKHLVLLDADDAELARQSVDLPARELAEAFREHGWPWAEADPHRAAYRLWVPDLPGLPAGANALLRARQEALKHDRGGEARELRAELSRYGVVVRDDGKRQHFRLTRRAALPD